MKERIPDIAGKGNEDLTYNNQAQTILAVINVRNTWDECRPEPVIPSTECVEKYNEWRRARMEGRVKQRKPRTDVRSLLVNTQEMLQYREREKHALIKKNTELTVEVRGKEETKKAYEAKEKEARDLANRESKAQADAARFKEQSSYDQGKRKRTFEELKSHKEELKAAKWDRLLKEGSIQRKKIRRGEKEGFKRRKAQFLPPILLDSRIIVFVSVTPPEIAASHRSLRRHHRHLITKPVAAQHRSSVHFASAFNAVPEPYRTTELLTRRRLQNRTRIPPRINGEPSNASGFPTPQSY